MFDFTISISCWHSWTFRVIRGEIFLEAFSRITLKRGFGRNLRTARYFTMSKICVSLCSLPASCHNLSGYFYALPIPKFWNQTHWIFHVLLIYPGTSPHYLVFSPCLRLPRIHDLLNSLDYSWKMMPAHMHERKLVKGSRIREKGWGDSFIGRVTAVFESSKFLILRCLSRSNFH